MRARFFGPDASTAHTTGAARARARRRVHLVDARHPRRRRRSTRLFARARPARSSSSSTPPRSPRTTGRRPTRRPTSRSTRTARSTCSRRRAGTRRRRPSSSARPTRSTATCPTRCRWSSVGTRLELPAGHRYHRRHRHLDVDRPLDALAVRRLEGRGRPARPGVRPLLRDADRLLSRRLPDRAQPRRHAAARIPLLPDALHGDRRAVHGVRLRGQAGARQHPLGRPRRRLRGLPRAPAGGGGLQHRRRPRRATARCWRRSTSCERDRRRASSTGRSPSTARVGDHRWWISDMRAVPRATTRRGSCATASRTSLREIYDAERERWSVSR